MISLPILLYSMSTLFEKKASPLPPSLVNTSTVTLLHGQQPSACLSQTLVEHRARMMLTVVGTARKMLSEYTQQTEVNNVAR